MSAEKLMRLIDMKVLFERFTARDCRAIRSVAIYGNGIYATDGRVLAYGQTGEEVDDSVPDGWPLGTARVMLKAEAGTWYEIPATQRQMFDAELETKLNAMIRDEHWHNKDRYTATCCPHCDHMMYWDSNNEKLVEEMEEELQYQPRDVEMGVLAHMDQVAYILNYGYLYYLMKYLGDIQIAGTKENAAKRNGNQFVLFRSLDEKVRGVLCPMRCIDNDYSGITDLLLDEVEDHGSGADAS